MFVLETEPGSSRTASSLNHQTISLSPLFFSFSPALGIEPKALCTLCMHLPIELHPQALLPILPGWGNSLFSCPLEKPTEMEEDGGRLISESTLSSSGFSLEVEPACSPEVSGACDIRKLCQEMGLEVGTGSSFPLNASRL